MSKVRKIERSPGSGRNYYIVDACFLVNKYIPSLLAPEGLQRQRVERCQAWWNEIERQLQARKARVYVPDICIAETFKTLAKKYFEEHWFPSAAELVKAKRQLRKDIVTPAKTMSALNREIRFHDIPTSRDIIISVDRFFERFHKHNLSVSLPDLIILATAKYLMDFFDIPKDKLHIITLDGNLWKGTKKIGQFAPAYNPTLDSNVMERIFI